jgi:thioredoxin 1
MSTTINHFTDSSFDQEVIKSKEPVLVDFWANWCMPCRFVAPVVEKLAGEYQGKIKVGKLDVDNNPMTAAQYGISSIPTILLYKGGEVVDGVIGAVPKEQLEKMIKKHLMPTN